MAQNPFVKYGLAGTTAAQTEYANNYTNPLLEASQQLAAKRAALEQQNALLAAQQQQALEDLKRQQEEQRKIDEALRREQQEALLAMKQPQTPATDPLAAPTAPAAPTNPLAAVIPLGVLNTVAGADAAQANIMKDAMEAAQSGAIPMQLGDGTTVHLDRAVLLESKDPAALMGEWIKTRPDFMELSTLGRRKALREGPGSFRQFLADVYGPTLRNKPQLAPNALEFDAIAKDLEANNKNVFDVEGRGILQMVGDTATAVAGGGAKVLIDLPTFAGKIKNSVEIGYGQIINSLFGEGTVNTDEDYEDLDKVIDRSTAAHNWVQNLQNAVYSDRTLDSQKAFAEAQRFGDTASALANDPGYLMVFGGDMVGMLAAPGTITKAGGWAVKTIGGIGAVSKGAKAVEATEAYTRTAAALSAMKSKSNLVQWYAKNPQFIRSAAVIGVVEGESTSQAVYQAADQMGISRRDVDAEAMGAATLKGGTAFVLNRYTHALGNRWAQWRTSAAARSLPQSAQNALNSAAGAAANSSLMGRALNRLPPTAQKFANGFMKEAVKSGMAEGFEEFMMGLIERAAVMGLNQNGDWESDRVDWSKAWSLALGDAMIGGILGGIIGGATHPRGGDVTVTPLDQDGNPINPDPVADAVQTAFDEALAKSRQRDREIAERHAAHDAEKAEARDWLRDTLQAVANQRSRQQEARDYLARRNQAEAEAQQQAAAQQAQHAQRQAEYDVLAQTPQANILAQAAESGDIRTNLLQRVADNLRQVEEAARQRDTLPPEVQQYEAVQEASLRRIQSALETMNRTTDALQRQTELRGAQQALAEMQAAYARLPKEYRAQYGLALSDATLLEAGAAMASMYPTDAITTQYQTLSRPIDDFTGGWDTAWATDNDAALDPEIQEWVDEWATTGKKPDGKPRAVMPKIVSETILRLMRNGDEAAFRAAWTLMDSMTYSQYTPALMMRYLASRFNLDGDQTTELVDVLVNDSNMRDVLDTVARRIIPGADLDTEEAKLVQNRELRQARNVLIDPDTVRSARGRQKEENAPVFNETAERIVGQLDDSGVADVVRNYLTREGSPYREQFSFLQSENTVNTPQEITDNVILNLTRRADYPLRSQDVLAAARLLQEQPASGSNPLLSYREGTGWKTGLYEHVYNKAVKEYDERIRDTYLPTRAQSRSEREALEEAITALKTPIEAERGLAENSDLYKQWVADFNMKDALNGKHKQYPRIIRAALQAAVNSIDAQREADTKKASTEALTAAAGFGAKRTRGGKANVNEAVEQAATTLREEARQTRRRKRRGDDDPIPDSQRTKPRPPPLDDAALTRQGEQGEALPHTKIDPESLFRRRREPVIRSLALRQQTQYITGQRLLHWARQFFDRAIADRVRIISPDFDQAMKEINGFVRVNDPNIYIVAHPDMDYEMLQWTIAHEAAHQGMHLRRADGTDVMHGEEYLQMLRDAETNPTVAKVRLAMRKIYPDVSEALLTEEALAELAAAHMTGDWQGIEREWGVKVPPSMRGQRSALTKLIDLFKALVGKLIAALGGKRRATDNQIYEYLRKIARNAHTAAVEGDLVKAYPDRLIETHRAYDSFLRATDSGWDERSDIGQEMALARVAEERGDTAMARYYYGDYQSRRKPDAPKPDPLTQKEKLDADSIADSIDGMMDVDETTRRLAKQATKIEVERVDTDYAIQFYDQTPMGAPRTEVKRGLIIPLRERNQIIVRYNQYDKQGEFVADRKVEYNRNQNEEWEDFQRRVEADVVNQGYELREAYGRIRSKLNYGGKQFDYDSFNQMVAGRITRWELFSPTFTRVAQAIRRAIPKAAEPVLDMVLDLLHTARAYFLSPDDVIQTVENAYNIYADKNGLNRLQEFLAIRQTRMDYDRELGRRGTSANPTFFDLKLAFAHEVSAYRDVVTREQIERHLHATEARIRDKEIVNRLGGKKGDTIYRLYQPGEVQETLSGFYRADHSRGDFAAEHYFSTEFTQLTPEQQTALNNITARYTRMVERTLDLMVQNGLIEPDKYVEAKRRGFWLSLKDYKESKVRGGTPAGRYSTPQNMVETSIDQMQNMLRTAYNQHAFQRIARIAMATPDNEYFSIEPYYPTRTGRGSYDFDYLRDDESAGRDRNTRIVKLEDGQMVYLRFKKSATELLKPTFSTNGGIRMLQQLTSTMGLFRTTLSPMFMAVAIPRDMATSFMNVQGAIGADLLKTEDAVPVARNLIQHSFGYLTKLWKAAVNDKVSSDPFLQLYTAEGAGLSWGAQVGYDQITKELGTAWNDADMGKVRRAWNLIKDTSKTKVTRTLHGISYAPEQMFRVGAMRAYMEYFASKGMLNITDWTDVGHMQAALNANPSLKTRIIDATKDITTNFERKGTNHLSRAFYVFFNAAMQGMFRTVPQILSTEHGRKMVTIAGALMLAQAFMGITAMGDDEDGESRYFRTSGRDRKRPLGNGLAVPIPPDLAILATAADSFAGVVTGKRNILDASGDLMASAVRSGIPLNWWHTEDSMLNFVGGVTPTVLTGVLADVTDTGYWGQALKRQTVYDPNTGQRIDSPTALEATPSTATPTGRGIAEMLAAAGIDKSGAEVDNWMEYFLGGAWTFFARLQRGGGESMVDNAMNAAFGGYMAKPNNYAVKDTADTLTAHARQIVRRLEQGGAELSLTDREELAKYKAVVADADAARKVIREMRGPYGTTADTWRLYLQAKNEGDYTSARLYKAQYDELMTMQNRVLAAVTKRAKAYGVYNDLK